MRNGTLIRHPAAAMLVASKMLFFVQFPNWIPQLLMDSLNFISGGWNLVWEQAEACWPRWTCISLCFDGIHVELCDSLEFTRCCRRVCRKLADVTLAESCRGAKASGFSRSRQIKPLLFLAFLDQSIKPDGSWRGIVCAVRKSNIIHIIFNWFPKGTWWCAKDRL